MKKGHIPARRFFKRSFLNLTLLSVWFYLCLVFMFVLSLSFTSFSASSAADENTDKFTADISADFYRNYVDVTYNFYFREATNHSATSSYQGSFILEVRANGGGITELYGYNYKEVVNSQAVYKAKIDKLTTTGTVISEGSCSGYFARKGGSWVEIKGLKIRFSIDQAKKLGKVTTHAWIDGLENQNERVYEIKNLEESIAKAGNSDLSEADIEVTMANPDETYVYSGEDIEPVISEVSLRVGSESYKLEEGKDYKLSYENNRNASRNNKSDEGSGESTAQTVSIVSASGSTTLSGDAGDGESIIPARIVINGIGKYTGKNSFNFIIEPRDITGADAGVDIPDQEYTGSEIKPLVDTVEEGDESSGDSNTGISTVAMSGALQSGKLHLRYSVGSSSDSGGEASGKPESGTGTGTGSGNNNGTGSGNLGAEPGDNSHDDSGFERGDSSGAESPKTENYIEYPNELTEGEDYELEYINNTDPGIATISIRGIGNYTGNIDEEFLIKRTSSKESSSVGFGEGLDEDTGDGSSDTIIVGPVVESKEGFNSITEEKDKDGNTLVYGSKYFKGDSSSNTVPWEHFGYATHPDIYGGGEERTYPEIIPLLKQGIDSGTWIDEGGFRYYRFSTGEFAKDGFALIKGPEPNIDGSFYWYYFDTEARLGIGWVKSVAEDWYYTSEDQGDHYGAIEIGWIYCAEDSRTYYMSEVNARMLTGWVGFAERKGAESSYYYFTKLYDISRQNWFSNIRPGKWVYDQAGYRSYGALYTNETTPDGYETDASGLCVGKVGAIA